MATLQQFAASGARQDFVPRSDLPASGLASGGSAYQRLKSELHRKLLGCVNLEALLSLPEERMRAETRTVLARLLDQDSAALNSMEQRRVTDEVLDEVF